VTSILLFSWRMFEILVITKGQIQTPPYRFLAKQGGYAWVQTQATMMSVPNRHIRSQAIVCIHTRLRWVHRAQWYKSIRFVSWHTYWYFCSTVTLRKEIKFCLSVKHNHQPMAQLRHNMTHPSNRFVAETDDSNGRRCPCLFIDKLQRNGHFNILFLFAEHFPIFLFISCLGYLYYLLTGVICLCHKVVTPSDEWLSGQKGSETMSPSQEMRPLFNWRSRQNERDGKLEVFTGLCSGFFKLFVINVAASLLSITWNSLIS
jgi:hypothetical protein